MPLTATPPTATTTLTIHPLLLGEVEVDKTFVAWASDPGKRLRIPTTAYLVLGGDGPLLVDASFRDPAAFTAASGVPARRTPEQELVRQLAAHGLEPGDVKHLLFTHLHHDHSGLAAQMPEARLLIQRAELQYAVTLGVPSGYWVDIADTMRGLRRIADDSEGIVLPMHDRAVYERFGAGVV